MTQLKFERMLEEVDKELEERAGRIKIRHVKDCKGSCILSVNIRQTEEVEEVTRIISFLVDYFKKYSSESVWGKWLQDYYHVKVTV